MRPGARSIAALLVLGFTWVAFLPALEGEFLNWDDEANLVRNPHYRGLSPSHLRWMFTTTHLGPYQPRGWLAPAPGPNTTAFENSRALALYTPR